MRLLPLLALVIAPALPLLADDASDAGVPDSPDAGFTDDDAPANDAVDAGAPVTATPNAAQATDAGPAGIAPAAPVDAGPETPKQRRKRERRERWKELAGVLGDKLHEKPADAPDAGPLAGAPAAAPGGVTTGDGWKLKPPDVGGYIQVHFRQPFHTGADPNVDFNDFRVQRVRVSLDGEVFPWLGYVVEIDPRAPEVKGILRDAYIELKAWHQKLRIGQQKTQFGYENNESSTELYAVNRTEMADNLSRANNLRDVGIGLIGSIELPAGFEIENALTLTNGAGFNVQADDTAQKNLWGRLGGRYTNGEWGDLDVRVGGSGGYGDFNDGPEYIFFRRAGIDAEIDQEWVFVSAEYAHAWDDVDGEPEELDGYYVNLVGKTPWSVGPIVRYDALADEYKRVTLGAYWGMPNDLLRVMVNYELRLVKDNSRGDDKLFVWVQVEF